MSNEPKLDPPVETPDRATLAARWEHRTATWLAFTDQPLSEFMRPFEREGWQIAAVTTGRNGGWCVFMKRQAADALAATCATCRHAGVATAGTRECYHPEWEALGHEVTSVPEHFHCAFYQPTPPTGRTEREG